MLVATLFNQLQRHTAVRRAARIGSSQAEVLEKLGRQANSEKITVLLKAKQEPDSPQAKRRATTWPKLSAMRAHYGVPQHWVTVAPPEQHSLEYIVSRYCDKKNSWNQTQEMFRKKECTHADLPESVRSGARGMLAVSSIYPALSARVFAEYLTILFTRVSRDYGQRPASAYGAIAVHAGVVVPQLDGRLHIHMSLYGSKYSPEFLSRVTSSPYLRMRATQFLESMCSTKFDKEVYRWHQSKIEQDGFVPKAFEMSLPAVTSGYTESCRDAQMRAAVANYHSHSSTCFKGNRDKYICRLARPAGVHEQPTCPLIVARERLGDMKAGPSLACAIDDGYSVEKGEAF
ncbi:hypothetical protein GQ600_19317 [Phytophthora cactorum]|nr:hypothetical protein GQ600_19317 [Phytophthora cactorum]